MRWIMLRWWPVLLLVVPLGLLAPPARSADFVIVVHPSVRGSQIRRSVLASIYQKDVVRWGNELRIVPVDQSGQATVREAFTREVLGLSLGEVQKFWEQRLATNRQLPPITRASDEEVLVFVASNKGAIGYVRPGTELPAGVRVVTLTD
jgi:ABC-type phosphate transport system substrate-binding protein